MIEYYKGDWKIWLGCICLVVFFGWLVVVVSAQLVTENACLRWGWKAGRTTTMLTRYCMSRIGQTDIVAPFAKASQGPLSYAREIGVRP